MNIHIATESGTHIPYQTMGFSGGERHIQLSDVSTLEMRYLVIRANLTSTDDLMDLLLLENALRNAFGQAIKINLELPYLPYARQDRVCANGQAFSLEVMAKLLGVMAINQLVTWDCHSNVGLELTAAHNVRPATIIQSDPALTQLLKDSLSVLVCPDKGAVTRCKDIQQTLGLKEIVLCEKRRDPATGKILSTEVMSDDLSGQCAVITDDICDGGYTFIKIAEQLRQKNVGRIVLFVTHGIFSKGLGVFDGLIDEVITTNSRPSLTQLPEVLSASNNAISSNEKSNKTTYRVIHYKHTFGEQL